MTKGVEGRDARVVIVAISYSVVPVGIVGRGGQRGSVLEIRNVPNFCSGGSDSCLRGEG